MNKHKDSRYMDTQNLSNYLSKVVNFTDALDFSFAHHSFVDLIPIVFKIRKSIIDSIDLLADTDYSFHQVQTKDLVFIFGPNWPGNPGYYSPVFWWRGPHEPDIIHLIAGIFNRHPSAFSLDYFRSFVHALLYAADTEIIDISKWDSTNMVFFNAEAEHIIVEKDKRIDLLLTYISSNSLCKQAVAIEAKFGASLDNPLDVYEEYLERKFERNVKLFVVGNSHRTSDVKKYKKWNFIFWHDVMLSWETILTSLRHEDHDFSRLRLSIWKKILVKVRGNP